MENIRKNNLKKNLEKSRKCLKKTLKNLKCLENVGKCRETGLNIQSTAGLNIPSGNQFKHSAMEPV